MAVREAKGAKQKLCPLVQLVQWKRGYRVGINLTPREYFLSMNPRLRDQDSYHCTILPFGKDALIINI